MVRLVIASAIVLLAATLCLPWFDGNAYAQDLYGDLERIKKEIAMLRQQVTRLSAVSVQKGEKGEKGEKGDPGPPGPKGDKGDPGSLNLQRVSFSEGRLDLKTKLGTFGATAAASDTGNAFQIFNGAAKKVASLGTIQGQGGGVVLWNAQGKQVAFLGALEDGYGHLVIDGTRIHDYAEVFELTDRRGVGPGTVMAVSGPGGQISPSSRRYERRVVGIISGAGGLQPGAVVGSRNDGSSDLPLAVSGQVYVRVCLEGGPIEPGDLLVASGRRGVAMRADDLTQATGAVVGKALEAFGSEQGVEGLVRMIVMLR